MSIRLTDPQVAEALALMQLETAAAAQHIEKAQEANDRAKSIASALHDLLLAEQSRTLRVVS